MSELNLIVLVKQVPDMSKVKFDEEKGRIDGSSAKAEPNPFDLNALEEAVTTRDEVGGGLLRLAWDPLKLNQL